MAIAMAMAVLLVKLVTIQADVAPSAAGDSPGVQERQATYIVVFDAGSTGTRAHVYTLKRQPDSIVGFTVAVSNSKKKKIGLSSFADKPERAGDLVKELLNDIGDIVPSEQRSRTFAIVRATAGLRLIDSFKRRRILKSVTDALSQSQYRTPEQNAVKVITGDQEAKFAWGAVNFMINKLQGPFVPVLEMGGGSMQIAYKADGDIKATTTFKVKSNIKLHTHSYLGLGASQAFLDHLDFKDDRPYNRTYETPCVAAGKEFTFVFGRHSVRVLGSDIDSDKRGEECLRRAREIVMNKSVHEEVRLNARDPTIYCLSAAYYQLKWIHSKSYGAVTKGNCSFDSDCKSYSTTVGDLRAAVQSSCANPADSGRYNPYYCFQMAVLSSFIDVGLKLDADTRVVGFSSKKAGWTLGAALELLNEKVDKGASNSCYPPMLLCLLMSCSALLVVAIGN